MSECTALDGIRVWRGFRAAPYLHDRQQFIDKLQTIFIPQTAQQMMPMGLRAYFPAILPQRLGSPDAHIPDEIALVVYDSNDAYKKATQKSVAGRAYGLLHSTVFNFDRDTVIPASTSDSPIAWHDDWCWDQSMTLLSSPVDWQRGQTSVLLAKPNRHLNMVDFCRSVNDIVCRWRQQEKLRVDGAILCMNRNWLLYWEHQLAFTGTVDSSHSESLVDHLLPVLELPQIQTNAKPVKVPPAFSSPDMGVACGVGELLSVRVFD